MTVLNLPALLAAVEDELGYELPATAAHVAKREARKAWDAGERDVDLIGADVAFYLAVHGLL